jgi:hypothetical protein
LIIRGFYYLFLILKNKDFIRSLMILISSTPAPLCQPSKKTPLSFFESFIDHRQNRCIDAGGRATHGAVAEDIDWAGGWDGLESVGAEGGFSQVAAEFSKISGGRGADCWGEWQPVVCERPWTL